MSSVRILSLSLLTSLCWIIPGQLNARAAFRGAEVAYQERRADGPRTVELSPALAMMDRLDNATKSRNKPAAARRP